MRKSNEKNTKNSVETIDVDWINGINAPHYNDYTDEERDKTFNIDRNAENADVERYKKTGDTAIFEKVYERRIPTLRVWARKNGHLLNGADDMFGEFSQVFFKAVNKYSIKKGSFNTYLFTLLLNCVKNIKNGKKAKKRRPINLDPNSTSNFVLSLDWGYHDEDGSGGTLKDILANSLSDGSNAIDDIHLSETINVLAKNDAKIQAFLRKLSNGETLSSIIKESKTKTGKIEITKKEVKKLDGGRKHKSIVVELIKDKADIKDNFALLDYHIESGFKNLHYTIEMNKTQESDLLMRALRKMRREEDSLMSKIYGEDRIFA